MAWVARYMTERFISRSRSQPAATSGALSTREPSPEGMLLRMAERSSGLLLVEQVDPGRQVADGADASLVKEHDRLAELDPIAGMQGGSGQRVAR